MTKQETKNVGSEEEAFLDVFEAIKRAFIRRGFVRHKTSAKKSTLARRRAKKLTDITMMAHEILFKANTVFPFTLFPDTVALDREKLTFAHRYFFGVAKITSVPIPDILSVEVDMGPFFGSVHTSSRFFITTPHTLNWLWRKDAIRLQRLLQGYIIAMEQEIDCTSIEKDKLVALLYDLGKGSTD